MKTLIVLSLASASLALAQGQRPNQPAPPIVVIQAAPQSAGNIVLPASAQWMTVLETKRLSTLAADGKTPKYSTVSAMLLDDPTILNYLLRAVHQYDPAQIKLDAEATVAAKLAQDKVDAANKAAQDAVKSVK